ncbi:MAG: hypothetical protein NVS2B7_09640 [Herpetosiphon sp.]
MVQAQRHRRPIVLTALTTLLLPLIVACGSPPATTSTTTTTANTTAAPAAAQTSGAPTRAAATPAAAAAASATCKQPTTLNIWTGYPEMEPFYNRVAEDYRKTHPDVTINVVSQPLRDYEKKLVASLPSNSAAEIIEVSTTWIGRFVQSGIVIPEAPQNITDFVRSPAFNSFNQENVSYKNKVYGVPLFRGQGVLFYNTDMFAKAGLKEPPQTMDQVIEDAQKLTQKDAAGKTTVSGLSLRLSGGGSGVAEKYWTWLHQYGGSLVKDMGNGKWASNYNNEAGLKTLQMYVDLVNKYHVDDPNIKHDAEAFELGQTAMFARESWVVGDIKKKAPDLKYNAVPLPNGTINLTQGLYVTKAAQCPTAAWDYVMFALKPEHQSWLLENVGWLPNRQDVDYGPVTDKIPQLKAFLKKPDEKWTFFTIPPVSVIDEIQTKLADRLTAAFVDTSLVDNPDGMRKFLQQAAAETDSLLKKANLQ